MDSYLVAPIRTRTRTYGWLGLGNKLGDSGFTDHDEQLLTTLAAQLAMGYENSRLFEELKQRAEDVQGEALEHRQSMEKYRMVVEQASDGIAIANERGEYVEVNPRMLQMLGYTREQFLTLKMRDLIPEEDYLRDPIPLNELDCGHVFRKEHRFIRGDRSLLDVENQYDAAGGRACAGHCARRFRA